jgi:hypothetical protein
LPTIEILNAVPELPSRPRDCALLVTVPTTREEFSADYRSGTDFVAGYLRTAGGLTADAGWEAYQPYASLARHVMTSARKLGVALVERATLAELHCAVAAWPVTTLVAHWRSARFRPPDIADAASVRAYLTKAGVTLPPANGNHEHEALCAALNAVLDQGTGDAAADTPMSHGGLSAQQFRWHERREVIEAALPGSFRGGAAVEFAGGFHTIAEITAGFAPAYAGTLDLTVCQSVLLGEMVRAKCPKSLVLSSAETTSMDFRFAVYHQVIEILARSPRPFEDAVIDVRKAVVRRYDKSGK